MARKYPDGTNVEVFKTPRNEWVRGEVLGHRERKDGDGNPVKDDFGNVVDEYFVQLSGYHAMSPDDPTHWFTERQIRRR